LELLALSWEDIKINEDAKTEGRMAVEAFITQEKALREQLAKMYDQFNQLTIETRNFMEQKATKDFTEYFTNKGFAIEVEKGEITASVGEVSITLNIEGDYSFVIHLRKQKEMTDACLFSIQPAEAIDVIDKQIWADEIRQDSNLPFAQKQIINLEHNKAVMENTLTHISNQKFVFKLTEYYFGDKTEFYCIEEILELLPNKMR